MKDKRPLSASPTTRLSSVDALRGVAALGVVLFHSGGGLTKLDNIRDLSALPLQLVCAFGFTGVYLFFVISGFCIHLHWARSACEVVGSIRPDFAAFWRRRFWRLYPPYFIAVLCCLFVQVVGSSQSAFHFSAYDLALHLAMLHNLDPHTVYSINPVFWTLSIEVQLYLAYFALLWLRGRLSWRWLLTVLLAARVFWFGYVAILEEVYEVRVPADEGALAHWFEWGLGAVAVEGYLGLIRLPSWSRSWVIGVLALTVAAGDSYLHRAGILSWAADRVAWLVESPAWGMGYFIVLNAVIVGEEQRRLRGLPRGIEWLAQVGLVSYSLYLTHMLVIRFFSARGWQTEMEGFHLGLSVLTLAMVSLATAWVFYRVAEKPFVTPSHGQPVRSDGAFVRVNSVFPQAISTGHRPEFF